MEAEEERLAAATQSEEERKLQDIGGVNNQVTYFILKLFNFGDSNSAHAPMVGS